jgi:hypothetical protein
MSKIKTLKGKQNYLFLINDASDSLNRHIFKKNKTYNKILRSSRLTKILIFPDKEIICKDFLPDDIKIKYRQDLDHYKSYFRDKLLDTTKLLDYTDYYKTDTHLNNKGALKIYKYFNKIMRDMHNTILLEEDVILQEIKTNNLNLIGKGIGDLTWDLNKGSMELEDISDIYYKLPKKYDFYCTKYDNTEKDFQILTNNLVNISLNYKNKIIDWECISKNILYYNNDKYEINKKVLIFHDSFLLYSISLYKNMFKEIYFIKNVYDDTYINKINPDYVFEFRVERFLI